MKEHVFKILEEISDNVNSEGLLKTPERVKSFYSNFITKDEFPKEKFTTFCDEGMDQMIAQTNITFYSICEHHMLPFFGTATVAYIPRGRIVGLSKLARVVNWYANRLQNQERLTMQIAKYLDEQLTPLGVAVSTTARHMCMEMRGVRSVNTSTRCNYLIGAFKIEEDTRNEFISLLGNK